MEHCESAGGRIWNIQNTARFSHKFSHRRSLIRRIKERILLLNFFCFLVIGRIHPVLHSIALSIKRLTCRYDGNCCVILGCLFWNNGDKFSQLTYQKEFIRDKFGCPFHSEKKKAKKKGATYVHITRNVISTLFHVRRA